jgi:hypothetical protein
MTLDEYRARGKAQAPRYFAMVNDRLQAADMRHRQLALQKASYWQQVQATQAVQQQATQQSFYAIQPRRTVNTHCNTFGNQVHCSSY